jgi:hypothetical protein
LTRDHAFRPGSGGTGKGPAAGGEHGSGTHAFQFAVQNYIAYADGLLASWQRNGRYDDFLPGVLGATRLYDDFLPGVLAATQLRIELPAVSWTAISLAV